jgi:hypothetical protein
MSFIEPMYTGLTYSIIITTYMWKLIDEFHNMYVCMYVWVTLTNECKRKIYPPSLRNRAHHPYFSQS